jgi:hypothetical protein
MQIYAYSLVFTLTRQKEQPVPGRSLGIDLLLQDVTGLAEQSGDIRNHDANSMKRSG